VVKEGFCHYVGIGYFSEEMGERWGIIKSEFLLTTNELYGMKLLKVEAKAFSLYDHVITVNKY